MKKGEDAAGFRTAIAYFPPAHWVQAAASSGRWIIEAEENYQKGGWRNRCYIAGPNGRQRLSIPLEKGKHRQQPIREVTISYRYDWWREHEQALRTAYGRAPFFEHFAPAVFAVAQQRPRTLWELNWQLLETTLSLLQLPIALVAANGFCPPGQPPYQWPDSLPDTLAPYEQVFGDRHGFLPGLSILDVLFCAGPGLLTV